jgi:hypothetical protein
MVTVINCLKWIKFYWNGDGKKLIIIVKIWGQKMSKMEGWKLMLKYDKKRSILRGQKVGRKWSKNDNSAGGSKWQKSTNFDAGPRGPLFYKFFEILHFFAKTLHFWTPKIDPQNGPYWKHHSPQIGCAFAPMGGSKKSLFGGSEGGPLGPKNVDTTI